MQGLRMTGWIAMAAAALLAAPAAAQSRDRDGIFVLGALHALHEQEQSFSYEGLRRIIEAIAPDVMVLEVRPDELVERGDTPGRPEYPAVVWRLLDERRVQAVAMEPGGELFAEMTGAAARAFEALERDDPAGAAWLASLRRSLEAALLAHWNHPADAQDEITADLARAYASAQTHLMGAERERGQAQWDDYMIERTRDAIRAHPGRRILVLASHRNRHVIEEALRADAQDRIVDIEAWLRERL